MKPSAIAAVLLLLSTLTQAQQPHISTTRKAGNQWVTARLDTNSGQFCVTAADGTPLLFTGAAAFTSYTSIFLDGDLFTNNSTMSAIRPNGAQSMPHVSAWTRPDCVGFHAVVTRQRSSLAVTQTLYPMAESDYGFIRVVTEIRNTSAVPVRTGMQLMYDLTIGKSDLVAVSVDKLPVPRESEWRNTAVPSDFYGTAAPSPYKVRGRLQHEQLTTPDRFIVGLWSYNGYLGAAHWNYESSPGRVFWDNATLLQWDEAPLAPGAVRSIVTDYGIEIVQGGSLDALCVTDTLALRKPVPPETLHVFSISVGVKNTAGAGLPDTVDVTIAPPAGVRLRPGNTAWQQLIVPPGTTRHAIWNLESDVLSTPQTARIPVTVEYHGRVIGLCERTVLFPGRNHDLRCHVSTTNVDNTGTGYTPNPVTVRATVRNNSTAPVTGLRCLLTPNNWGATLLSPAVVPLTPDTIQPGDEGTALWDVQVPVHFSPQSHQYTITLMGAQGTCTGSIETPGITPHLTTCTDQHTTLGTDFWIAYPNPWRSYTQTTLGTMGPRLLLVAQERTSIQIVHSATGARIDTTLEAWQQGVFALDTMLETHASETVTSQTVHVTSSRPIACMASIDKWMIIDATTVLPTNVLGTRYMMLANDKATAQNSEQDEILIVATADRTTVTVTPSDTTGAGWLPGQPFVTVLGRGEVLPVFGNGSVGNSLYGSTVVADKPVAVFSASNISWILKHPAGNSLFEQLPAEEDYGDAYVVLPYRSRGARTAVRLLAAADNTTIRRDGLPWVTLARRGDIFESWIQNPPAFLEGSAPFLAAQYTASGSEDSLHASDGREFYGDPSMAFLVPQTAFAGCHVFSAGPPRYNNFSTPPTAPWDSMFVSFAVFAGSESAVLLDGRPPNCEFRAVPGGILSAASVNIRPGLHKLETSDPRGIFGLSYGFAKFDAYSTTTSRTFKYPKTITSAAAQTHPAELALTVSPNPAPGSATITFTVPGTARVRLELVDVLGQVRSVPLDAETAAGLHQIGLDTRQFTPGRYWLRMVTERGVLSTRLVVVR